MKMKHFLQVFIIINPISGGLIVRSHFFRQLFIFQKIIDFTVILFYLKLAPSALKTFKMSLLVGLTLMVSGD